MANRNLSERYALEKRGIDVYAHVTFGNTGAPTLDTTASKGVASISRTSQGLFVITLSDRFVRLLDLGWVFKVAAGSFPAAPNAQLAAETVSTTKTITIQFVNPAGTTATDPANTEQVYLTFTLADSSAF